MNYHNITKDDMLNGDGLRVVLWVSGCDHHCRGCHNPITWDKDGGLLFDQNAKQEIFEQLEKDYIHGITFSGGDPLMPCNRECVGNLIEEIHTKYPKKTIWLYTGYLFDQVKNLDFLNNVDVLVDGKFEIENRDTNAHWVGSTNQRVIDCKKSISCDKICLHI